MIEEYLNQDINNPKYLFHGSSYLLNEITPRQSYDSSGNKNNIAKAVFLFPSFLKATPYAFMDTIKKFNEHYYFEVPNTNDSILVTIRDVEYIDEDIIGYIYVFKKDDRMIKDDKSYQYKCYSELKPHDIVEVKYKDFKQYYNYIDPNIKRR